MWSKSRLVYLSHVPCALPSLFLLLLKRLRLMWSAQKFGLRRCAHPATPFVAESSEYQIENFVTFWKQRQYVNFDSFEKLTQPQLKETCAIRLDSLQRLLRRFSPAVEEACVSTVMLISANWNSAVFSKARPVEVISYLLTTRQN